MPVPEIGFESSQPTNGLSVFGGGGSKKVLKKKSCSNISVVDKHRLLSDLNFFQAVRLDWQPIVGNLVDCSSGSKKVANC